MGIFDRMKRSVKSKANAAVDKLSDPEKELELAIEELEEMRRGAIQELITYKATAKQMEQQLEQEEKRAAEWEKRAMAAVKAGDDELAKKALIERQHSLGEIAKIKRDRDEAAGYAIQLNRSRKTAEHKLKMLKLRKGTLANQMRAAKGDSPLSVNNELFDKLAAAEQAIDDEAIEAEVFAAMTGEDMDDDMTAAAFDQKLLAAGGDLDDLNRPGADEQDPLAALKAKMAAEKDKKLLK